MYASVTGFRFLRDFSFVCFGQMGYRRNKMLNDKTVKDLHSHVSRDFEWDENTLICGFR